ncbi:protein ROOT PRIMORDIUM DEFECTIVE 1-like [Solanum tuberosum]|uniref:protein ROOT PRIMORDIUM DEFECTIVE 1-like n=1 Tax=Solanum tuberosum TaxID=4113 RepID=UPI0003D26AB7|nr:PREDICTED: protein ROOT PRIMORDIUM DEFECTIVE 1-like [Solanum tuberosum]
MTPSPPPPPPPSFPPPRLSQRLHLNRGATHFLRKYPHIFNIFHHPIKLQPYCTLTETALKITQQEATAINATLPLVVTRLVRLLSISVTKSLPLRAIFKVFRELGLPDDFEESVILKKSDLFALVDSDNEPNTHLLKLVGDIPKGELVAAVDNWRVVECCKEDCGVDRNEILFSFKHSYPPGMKLKRNFKAKVKEWQQLRYVGPYEAVEIGKKRKNKIGMMEMEKRAVGHDHGVRVSFRAPHLITQDTCHLPPTTGTRSLHFNRLFPFLWLLISVFVFFGSWWTKCLPSQCCSPEFLSIDLYNYFAMYTIFAQ